MLKSGIYKILNLINGKFYIGSTINFDTRWRLHKKDLKLNKHKNEHLQNAWNKYGEKVFEFIILERCPIDILVKLEQFYLDTTNCADRTIGYNICAIANVTLGYRHSEKIKEMLKRPKSKEHKQKLSNFAKNRSQAHNNKIKLSNTGKIASQETKNKMSKTRLGKGKGLENSNRNIKKWPHPWGAKCSCDDCRVKRNQQKMNLESYKCRRRTLNQQKSLPNAMELKQSYLDHPE